MAICIAGWEGKNLLDLILSVPSCSISQHTHYNRDAEGRKDQVLILIFFPHNIIQLPTEHIIAFGDIFCPLHIFRIYCIVIISWGVE